MFAALNSVEQDLQNLTSIDLFFPNEEWGRQRRPAAEKMAQSRLDGLAAALAIATTWSMNSRRRTS